MQSPTALLHYSSSYNPTFPGLPLCLCGETEVLRYAQDFGSGLPLRSRPLDASS